MINDRLTSLLTTFLDVQSRRAEVVSANIANADTPGYTAKELKFDDFLRDAAREMMSPDSADASKAHATGAPTLVEQSGNPVGVDGNNVDTAREMSALADAGMQYLAGAQMLQSRLKLMRAAIKG